jgi:glycosyltransferase involved in cell wall biosynthesis
MTRLNSEKISSISREQYDKNVLFVSSSYPQNAKDWKSVFVRQLLSAISETTFTKISYWGPPGAIPSNVKPVCLISEDQWLDKLMNQGGVIHLVRQGGVSRYIVPLRLLYYLWRTYKNNKTIDLYHVNWLQNAIPLLWRRKSAVISVFGSDYGLLKVPGMTFLLRIMLKHNSSVLAPNAEWMVNTLEQKFGDLCRVVCVPLGIDDGWYKIQREWLKQFPRKWLVISRITKGKIGKLFDWGEDIFAKNGSHELHLFGPMQEDFEIPDWVHYHGSTYPDELMEKWFPKATGLITLSQHDEGRPQVMLEAMASGVPIIASKIAAHEDFIVHKKTGLLPFSKEEFINCIDWVSLESNNQLISEAARTWVANEIGTWDDCAERYVNVYSSLLQGQ